jgi:hypothetical protein
MKVACTERAMVAIGARMTHSSQLPDNARAVVATGVLGIGGNAPTAYVAQTDIKRIPNGFQTDETAEIGLAYGSNGYDFASRGRSFWLYLGEA